MNEVVAYESAPLEARMKYAETLAYGGDLIPKGLRGPDGRPSPGKILLVAETGSMLGLHPVAAIQGVNVIDGKPTISPALMSAVVRRAGHKLRVTTSGSVADGSFEATAVLIRSDDPDHEFRVTWGKERAQRAGLMGKQNWKNYFEAMCKARAISEVCREGGEDALMGVAYVPEELGATVNEEGVPVEPVVESEPIRVVERKPDRDWATAIDSASTVDQLREVHAAASDVGALALVLRGGVTVHDALYARKALLEGDER